MDNCSFRSIECPYWKCPLRVPLENVENHLEKYHYSVSWPTIDGKVEGFKYILKPWLFNEPQKEELTLTPITIAFDGRTFLANGIIRDGTWILWTSILASERDSQGYQIKMTAAPKGNMPANVTFRGKVYSVDLGKGNMLLDDGGVLELSKSMANKLGKIEDGKFEIEIDWEIIKL